MVYSFYGVKVTLIFLSCSCLNMFYNIKVLFLHFWTVNIVCGI